MYLLKAKKRVASQPSVLDEQCRVSPPDSEKYKNRQPRIDTNGKLAGILRPCKYIGTFNVRSMLSHEARASFVKTHLETLMTQYKIKPKKDFKLVTLQMLDQGVKVLNKDMKCVLMAHALSRISYSVAEPKDGLLAFVAKDPPGAASQTYCHAFIFDNPKQASEINTTLGNAFRLAYCKRTLKRRTIKKDSSSSHNTNSTSSSCSSSNIKQNGHNNAPIPRTSVSNRKHHIHDSTVIENQNSENLNNKSQLITKLSNNSKSSRKEENNKHKHRAISPSKVPRKFDPLLRENNLIHNKDNVVGDKRTSPNRSPKRSPTDLSCIQDTDPEARIKEWLGAVRKSPPLVTQPHIKCKRSDSIQPSSNAVVMPDVRRPSQIAQNHINIPQELKDQEWFQAGVPRQIALECLSMECEGAFIVRNSQTHKGCYALSLRGPGRGNSGTYHYLISQNSEGFFFQGGGKVFQDLSSLILHHCYEQEGLACKLTLNRNNPLYGHESEADSSDVDEDPDYEQPPDEKFTTLLATSPRGSPPGTTR